MPLSSIICIVCPKPWCFIFDDRKPCASAMLPLVLWRLSCSRPRHARDDESPPKDRDAAVDSVLPAVDDSLPWAAAQSAAAAAAAAASGNSDVAVAVASGNGTPAVHPFAKEIELLSQQAPPLQLPPWQSPLPAPPLGSGKEEYVFVDSVPHLAAAAMEL